MRREVVTRHCWLITVQLTNQTSRLNIILFFFIILKSQNIISTCPSLLECRWSLLEGQAYPSGSRALSSAPVFRHRPRRQEEDQNNIFHYITHFLNEPVVVTIAFIELSPSLIELQSHKYWKVDASWRCNMVVNATRRFLYSPLVPWPRNFLRLLLDHIIFMSHFSKSSMNWGTPIHLLKCER